MVWRTGQGRLPGDEEWKIMLRKWLFAVSCVVSLSTWIASPGLAQTASERATMILSKLPPHGSAAYRALRKQAGDEATVEILSMTKSEVGPLLQTGSTRSRPQPPA